MSSHHFVKEGQEPALFIVDPVSLELVQPLLEWAPLVMVLDTALDEVMAWGIKIDVVLTLRDQVEKTEEKVLEQAPVKIIPYEAGENPLSSGFHFLINSKQSGVTVIIESGDDSVFTFVQDFSIKLNVALLNKELKWCFIEAREYKKWFPSQARIKIRHSVDQQEFLTEGIASSNSDWYRVEEDAPITIRSENNFWVGEELDLT